MTDSCKNNTKSLPADDRISVGMLILLWLATGLAWYFSCSRITTPRIFPDELNYWHLARNFYEGVRPSYWSVNYDIPAKLYSLLISPVFAAGVVVKAYGIARIIGPFLMATVVFPAYLQARELVERRYAAAVAILSGAVPGMVYSSMLMTEILFYPLFVGAFWLGYRALSSGKFRDAVPAGLLILAAYYTKPHVLGLLLAYTLCAFLYLLLSLLGHARTDSQQPWVGFGIRMIPIITFALGLIPRVLFLPESGRTVGGILLGRGYTEVLQRTVWDLHSLFAAWSGLLLSTLIATVFVPFAVFVESSRRLKSMQWHHRWFWIFAASVWLIYSALAARHTVLIDDAIRIHERYIFLAFPPFFTWFFLAWKQISQMTLAVASLITTLIAGLIMYSLAHFFLAYHVNSDAPSLTGFLGIGISQRLNYVDLAVAVIVLGCLATFAACSRNVWLTLGAWVLFLICANFSWLEFQNRWISPFHLKLQRFAMGITEQVGPRATLGVFLPDDKEMLAECYLDFYAERPTVIYLNESSPSWRGLPSANSPNARALLVSSEGQLVFGDPLPDYLFTTLQLGTPFKIVAPPSIINGYQTFLYQIPRHETFSTTQ